MSGLSRQGQILQAQLTRKFMATFAEKRARFETSWNQVQTSRWSEKSQTQLRNLAHKLAGSAGSYGFEELSTLAHNLDVSLEKVESSKEQHLLIERHVEHLIEALMEGEK